MQRNSTTQKHNAAYEYFVELYDKKRVRIDDAIKKTAEKYFYSTPTVEDIIRKKKREAITT